LQQFKSAYCFFFEKSYFFIFSNELSLEPKEVFCDNSRANQVFAIVVFALGPYAGYLFAWFFFGTDALPWFLDHIKHDLALL
jgi:hypothetical protein